MKSTVDIPSLSTTHSSAVPVEHVPSTSSKSPLPTKFHSLTFGRWCMCVGFCLLLAMCVLMVCLRYGTQVIDIQKIVYILFQSLTAVSSGDAAMDPTNVILLHVRLPRLILAFFVGGSLAAVGVSLQALLRNPLADPSVLGISSGAALGAAVALLFGIGGSMWSLSALPICAFLGAVLSLLIIYRIAVTQYGFSIYTLLLAGVVLSAIFSALIMFLTSIADPNRAFGMLAWLLGSLTGPDYETLAILTVYLGIGLCVLGSQAQSLNLLTLGEEAARSLGVEVERVKKMVFFATALMTGAVVAFSGVIGFVGLIVPHAVRLALGADHRLLLPLAALTGGMFLMAADTVARTLFSPAEIPVGVVTALVGGPIFLYLLMNRRAQLVT
ncbi:MAG: FecCD family ABC transporter permease [Nitrospirales bacterium]